MKIDDVLDENNFVHPARKEGSHAFWDGKQPGHCPYEEESKERMHWLAGWKEASLSGE